MEKIVSRVKHFQKKKKKNANTQSHSTWKNPTRVIPNARMNTLVYIFGRVKTIGREKFGPDRSVSNVNE